MYWDNLIVRPVKDTLGENPSGGLAPLRTFAAKSLIEVLSKKARTPAFTLGDDGLVPFLTSAERAEGCLTLVPSLMPTFDALAFVVLGVTKHAFSGIGNDREHSIQTSHAASRVTSACISEPDSRPAIWRLGRHEHVLVRSHLPVSSIRRLPHQVSNPA